jgi:tetratricopeptide (TPR) repeat protein
MQEVCRALGVSVKAPVQQFFGSRSVPVFRVLVFLALAGVQSASADLWYQHYEKAQEAMKRQEWEAAVNELNQAIQRRGDSGARVRTYGMRTTDYFPYLDLGVAYLNLEQPDAALQAFQTEERLGAVEGSSEARTRLERYRGEAQEAIDKRAQVEQERIDQILRDAVSEAQLLAEADRLDEAMVVLGRGLAVAPDDVGANTLMMEIRQVARDRESSREQDRQVETLVAQGSELLEEGALDEAANRFRQALSLEPENVAIEDLLQQAQTGLRQKIELQSEAGTRVLDIQSTLAEVDRLAAEDRLDEALTLLQTILVLEPQSERAVELENRLLVARGQRRQEAADLLAVEEEIDGANRFFSEGRFEESLSAANRALAVAPENSEALALVARSYMEISRVLLGRGTGGNIPPAIRFADFRKQREDGSLAQVVRDPEFRITGMVIDNSPVELRVFDAQDRPLEVEVNPQQLGDFYLSQFQVDLGLETGPETVRVEATDAEELSASSEYMVVYVRPRFKSPWFLGSVAALLVGWVAMAAVRRSRRRARRRQRRFNPYVAGAPVLDEELFFGRDALIDRILQTIHNNSLLLFGERRIGKTSIQHHLKKRLLELQDPVYDFYPVYVDLQGTPEDRFFATIAEDVFHQLAGQVEVPDRPSFEDEKEEYSYRDLVRDLRGVIRQLEDNSERKVKLVLLIDEVDELNDYDPRINQRLRSLFMKSFAESLVAVVSGVEIKKHWERVGSPWYNFFEEIEVLPLSDEEARNLIERPIDGVLRMDDGVADRIVEITGKRPYLIQKMCISLVNQAYEKGNAAISVADAEAMAPVEAT